LVSLACSRYQINRLRTFPPHFSHPKGRCRSPGLAAVSEIQTPIYKHSHKEVARRARTWQSGVAIAGDVSFAAKRLPRTEERETTHVPTRQLFLAALSLIKRSSLSARTRLPAFASRTSAQPSVLETPKFWYQYCTGTYRSVRQAELLPSSSSCVQFTTTPFLFTARIPFTYILHGNLRGAAE
jgi:hypothetical protein